MPYDPVADFAGITPLGNVPLVLVISPEKNIKTLKQLVDLAKAKPGTLNYATAGIGSPTHLVIERFRFASGFVGQVVPFRGAPEALTEVLAGRVDVYFCPLPPAIGFIREGKLLPLAVSERQARRRPARRADHHRGRLSRFRFRLLDRLFVPEEDAARRREQAACRDREGAGEPRREGKARQDGSGTHDHAARKPSTRRVAKEAPIAVEIARAAGIAAK